MLTYMRLLKIENGFVIYEYGDSRDEMIGTVTIEIADNENVTFSYYPDSKTKEFCPSTAHTITKMYGFIRDNSFPDEYTYAC